MIADDQLRMGVDAGHPHKLRTGESVISGASYPRTMECLQLVLPKAASGLLPRSPLDPRDMPHRRHTALKWEVTLEGTTLRDEEHHVQDALEIYAVGLLQQLAQQAGLAMTADADVKLAAFVAYAKLRGYTLDDFETGRWSAYKAAYDKHLPVFFERLVTRFPGESLDFVNVEVENRNAQLKGDFHIVLSSRRHISVSLKNYRNGALRPQLNSGTYNSFILNFLFDSPGVGTFTDPMSGLPFRSTPAPVRNKVFEANGFAAIIPLMQKMDALNFEIRARFIATPEFEFLDEAVFDRARKECGEAGATVALEILGSIDPARLKARALKMIGMDGAEEMLLMDPDRFADSITNETFGRLRDRLQDVATTLRVGRRGQGLGFDFVSNGEVILQVDVPFTINKNGAWISGDAYEGTRWHAKERKDLAYGQRRPKKSRELATSINTYVNFGATGIFEVTTAVSTGPLDIEGKA